MRKKNRVLIISLVSFILSISFIIYPHISGCFIKSTADAKKQSFDDIKKEISLNGYKNEPASDRTVENTENTKENRNDREHPENSQEMKEVIGTYDISKLYDDCIRYNESLKLHQSFKNGFEMPAVDLESCGINTDAFAFLKIDSIGLFLPVFLGASGYNMSRGAAHLYGTSLPLKGEDTNCVLCGHTSYTGCIFFDNLRALKKGDVIVLETLFDTLVYKVDSMQTIGPVAGYECCIHKGEELLTLLTCDDNGKNRFMVVCKRKE